MKKRFIIPLSLFLVTAIFWGFKESGSAKEEVNLELEKVVKVSEVKKDILTETISFSAFIKHEKEVILTPEVSGRLLQVLQDNGDFVKKGQMLAKIDAEEFLAQAALTRKEIGSSENNAIKTEDYYDQLVDEAEIALEKADNLYSDAKDDSDENEKRIAKRNKESAEEALKSARRLRDLQTSVAKGQVNILKQQSVLNNVQVENTKIKAPFDGIIAKKYQEEGDLIAPGEAIFMLVDDSGRFEVELALPLKLAKNISVGQKLLAKNENNKERNLTVKSISPVSDQITRKVAIKLEVSGENLVSGEFLEIVVPAIFLNDVTLVPIESILRDYHEDVVFVVEEGVARKKVVELGVSDGRFVEVKKGLEIGQMVIMEGHQDLISGNKIKIYGK